ncbi:transcriptional regulator, TetR family [Rhodoferax sp. OV413]|uniref:TetR/AcrR family transcriptional regulator n=1 Tax=Rhodoferax sp. OV413 TaxID=1855285 RepID=UPI000880E93F|nr:TetR/AcrR family transcriptional regulator [Rhodoferax sp. OV413]SDP38009.1 transcriptional regulator, TetR family [Rhodoferax sp. OV413]
MKVSREQANENRERVLQVAAKLFRERGFDGVGLADIMKSAGLTHGGFYGQFASKEDLMAQASTRAFDGGVAWWNQLAADTPDQPLQAVTSRFLSTSHRDQPGKGCWVAALGSEVARQPPSVRHALTEGITAMAGLLMQWMPGRSKAAKREKAFAAYASMVGGLVLARAVDDAALSEEILQAVAHSLPKGAAA